MGPVTPCHKEQGIAGRRVQGSVRLVQLEAAHGAADRATALHGELEHLARMHGHLPELREAAGAATLALKAQPA